MDWPVDSQSPPEYFSNGMSFDDLLQSYKLFQRSHKTSKPVQPPRGEMEDDSDGQSNNRRVKLGIRTKQGSITKSARNSKQQQLRQLNKHPSAGVTVSVRNLPFRTSDGELRMHFSHLGRILKVCFGPHHLY